MIIGVLALAVVVLLIDKVWLSGEGQGEVVKAATVEKSVAVCHSLI